MAQEFNRNHRDFSGNVTRPPRTRCGRSKNYKTIKDEFEEENMICDGAKVINKAKQDKVHRRNRKKNKKRQRKSMEHVQVKRN